MSDIIEGQAVEIPERAVVVAPQPGQVLASERPDVMVERAAHLATVLADIVAKRHLYADIQGKRYPTVEAWMTIARLDNVVCREVDGGIERLESGAYEATVELVRLSDGMVIGRGSALCGTAGDKPWDGRPEPARRSMAVTRATSRAFRQQYSWIMALAGYEPTPAEEMPHDPPAQRPAASSSRGGAAAVDGGPWQGKAATGKAPADGLLRQTPYGFAFGFILLEPNGDRQPRRLHVLAEGELAKALDLAFAGVVGGEAKVEGTLEHVPFGDDSNRTYRRVRASRVATADFIVPGPSEPAVESGKADDLDTLSW